MAKPTTRFVCQNCGAVTGKWAGRCDACGEWNTIVEEPVETRPGAPKAARANRPDSISSACKAPPTRRRARRPGSPNWTACWAAAWSRPPPCWWAAIPASASPPCCCRPLPRSPGPGKRVLYITGEESVDQVRLRARRLGLADARLELAATINVRDIAAALEGAGDAAMVVIDSIQTMWMDSIDSAPGTVSQVRACSFELIRLAKSRGFALVLVGHVTKEGALAGPRVLEHMVDAVLYFEGDRGHQFRILRGVKNRFGATDEIGVFAMTETGLAEVPNPSALFLAERRGNIAGSAVFAGLEGTRPVLVEVQALLSPNAGGSPRRSVIGWDGGRLAMMLAVLDSRAGLRLSAHDVYLNVAGGLRVSEPAADLAVAAALASAATETPTDAGTVYFGEVGLSGEIRQVAQADARLKEAQKLGFAAASLPRRLAQGGRKPVALPGLRLNEMGHLAELVAGFSGKG